MGNIHHQAIVHAPPQAVYDYVADVRNTSAYISAFQAVQSGPEPPGPPAVGQHYRVAALFLGNPAHLQVRLVRLDPGELVQMALEGQPSGLISVQLKPVHAGTATQVALTLDTPQFNSFMLNMVLGGMLEDALHRLNATLRAAP